VYTRNEDDERDQQVSDDDSESEDQTMGDRPNGGPLAADTDWLSFVEYESRFDSLSILAPRDRRRYGDVYRTMGVTEEGELPVGITLFHGPTGADGAREFDSAFVSAVGERLDDWASVAATDNVVTLYDWATEPRLWAATEYTDETLADRGRLQPDEAAWHAERLAEAVATLHERGVVHAGIDPQSVAYYGNVLEEGDRQPPLLDNVGLLHAYRAQFDPSTFLDPRYAAPEYYERRFGRIDHATDIYQLGAVCYRLFTGRPPYAGEFDTVRERVLNAPPPTPSDVSSVPDAVDDVVGKAMATQKLHRYETAAHLAQELRALRDPRRDNGG
jgi:serine/threonine protein kinase